MTNDKSSLAITESDLHKWNEIKKAPKTFNVWHVLKIL